MLYYKIVILSRGSACNSCFAEACEIPAKNVSSLAKAQDSEEIVFSAGERWKVSYYEQLTSGPWTDEASLSGVVGSLSRITTPPRQCLSTVEPYKEDAVIPRLRGQCRESYVRITEIRRPE